MSWCLLFTIKYFSRERVCEREHKYGKMNTYKCRWVYGVHYIITHRSLGVTMFQNSDFLRLLKKSQFSSPWDLSQMSFTAKFMGEKRVQNCMDFRTVDGEGNGNPLQCSRLENPRDGRAWWAAAYGVAQSWTRLKQLSSSSSRPVDKRSWICTSVSLSSI